jgi:quercetin dioxygenase-like cupin family protein
MTMRAFALSKFCTLSLIPAAGAGWLLASVPAFAGSCPADKLATDVREPDRTPAKGVTDTVIASIDVAKEPAAIDGRLFRMRKLTIEPGGVVPWHSHHDRPAIIYVVSGEIVEFASNCSVPIVHKAGEVTAETSATAHWWRNLGKQTVVLLSADLLATGRDAHMM